MPRKRVDFLSVTRGNTAKAVQVVGVLFLIAENTLIAICHPFSVHFNVITVEWI